jgi:hypothetical protein
MWSCIDNFQVTLLQYRLFSITFSCVVDLGQSGCLETRRSDLAEGGRSRHRRKYCGRRWEEQALPNSYDRRGSGRRAGYWRREEQVGGAIAELASKTGSRGAIEVADEMGYQGSRLAGRRAHTSHEEEARERAGRSGELPLSWPMRQGARQSPSRPSARRLRRRQSEHEGGGTGGKTSGGTSVLKNAGCDLHFGKRRE